MASLRRRVVLRPLFSSANSTVYQWSGTITGFTDADFVGQYFAFAGFANSGNNGSFECVWSGSGYQSVIVVNNPSGVSEPSPAGTPSVVCLTDQQYDEC